MYQLKITKNTDALALQHFNNVKGRLLDDINYFLSGKNRIMNKEKINKKFKPLVLKWIGLFLAIKSKKMLKSVAFYN